MSYLVTFIVFPGILFFFGLYYSIAICLYVLQLKHLGFLFLSKFSLAFPMFMGAPCPLYIVFFFSLVYILWIYILILLR